MMKREQGLRLVFAAAVLALVAIGAAQATLPLPLSLWRSAHRFGPDLLARVGSGTAQSITVPARVEGNVTSANVLPNGDLGMVFVLDGLSAGMSLMVEMLDPRRSWEMDTYLYLYDLSAGRIIADNDDSPDTNRSEITFTVEPGIRYAVVASSWIGYDMGPFVLTVEHLEQSEPTREAQSASEPIAGSAASVAGQADFVEIVREGLPDEVRAAIQVGADVNARDSFDWTVLMYAAGWNTNPEVVQVLLDAGADVNTRDDDGLTALMRAAWENSEAAVTQALIDAGADINARSNNGRTALMLAAWFNPNPAVTQLLIDAGADINARDNDSRTALMLAAWFNPNPAAMQALIDAGADINARDNDGRTATQAFAETSTRDTTETAVSRPDNDHFANATLITGASGRAVGTNTNATREASEQTRFSEPLGNVAVWWRWTPIQSGTVAFDTAGSSFDTVLSVFTGSQLGASDFVLIGTNDDAPGLGTRSRLSFQATSGTTYHIAVGGYRGATGSITLNWSQHPHSADGGAGTQAVFNAVLTAVRASYRVDTRTPCTFTRGNFGLPNGTQHFHCIVVHDLEPMTARLERALEGQGSTQPQVTIIQRPTSSRVSYVIRVSAAEGNAYVTQTPVAWGGFSFLAVWADPSR